MKPCVFFFSFFRLISAPRTLSFSSFQTSTTSPATRPTKSIPDQPAQGRELRQVLQEDGRGRDAAQRRLKVHHRQPARGRVQGVQHGQRRVRSSGERRRRRPPGGLIHDERTARIRSSDQHAHLFTPSPFMFNAVFLLLCCHFKSATASPYYNFKNLPSAPICTQLHCSFYHITRLSRKRILPRLRQMK